MARRRWLLAVAALPCLMAFAATLSCNAKPNTEVVLSISTDMLTPKDLKSLHLQVTSFGSNRFSNGYELGPNGLLLPATMGVLADKPDNAGTIEVIVTASPRREGAADDWSIMRRVRFTFAKDRTVLLRVPLRAACQGVLTCSSTVTSNCCAEGETCIDGACTATPTVDGNRLADYRPEDVFGSDAQPDAPADPQTRACWDLDRCLPTAAPLVPLAEPCAYQLTGDVAGSMTVVVVRSLPSSSTLGHCEGGACRIALDSDPELWSVDASRVLRLSKGLCNSAFLKVPGTSIWGSTACGPKRPEQPFCPAQGGTSVTPSSSSDAGNDANSDANSDGSSDVGVAADSEVGLDAI